MSAVVPTYHHGNLKQALLDKALAQLKEVGPDKLSLRALARDIGVSQTAPYRHFSDKTDLLACLAAEGFRRLRDATLRVIKEHDGALQQLHASGRAYVLFARQNADLYRLMFGPMIPPELDHEELKSAGNEALSTFISIIHHGIERGAIAPENPMVWANCAWCMVHGIASLLIDDRFMCTETQFLDEDLEKALALLERGMALRG